MSQTTPWPSPSDYSTAIQNPQNNCSDPILRQGKPTVNQLGLPIGASGNFAVVYQMESSGTRYAVRCFIRPVTDQQQRYDALTRSLKSVSLPGLVDFAYLPEGIRVRGRWYPVVRMEWVGGQHLSRYVAAHLHQGAVLEQLAARFRSMVEAFGSARMAHGDLQHGNVLVDAQGQMRLVDYDGLFVPALRGKPPGEVGHPNYQHAERIRDGYYEENVDAFAARVIYLSLLALRADPTLWSFNTGENLIFLAGDYKQPGRTPIWSRLHASPDPEVRRLTVELEGFARGPVAAIPAWKRLYSAPVSQANPGCLLFLVDQSSTMRTPFGGVGGRSKAEQVADAINRALFDLAGTANAPSHFEVGVIGYGGGVRPALGGTLAGRSLVPMQVLLQQPVRVEERRRKVESGGGLVEQLARFPVWVDPVAGDGRPLVEALRLAHSILRPWVQAHPDSFPPVVVNISSGAATDGDPRPSADALRSLATGDGNLLLFNALIPAHQGASVLYPESDAGLRDPASREFFQMSSVLPDAIRERMQREGVVVAPQARGFILSGRIVEIIQLLEIAA